MALTPEQKKFEIERAKIIVTALYEGGHEKAWTAAELGKVVTDSLGTDGSDVSSGDNKTAAGWIMEGMVKSKVMLQNDDGSRQVTEEAVFQYNNKSNFFSVKTPVGMVKVRQGAVVNVI
jgi:hypothetical protein